MTDRDIKPGNPCAARGCEREHAHRGLHMSRTWDPATCSEVVDEWGDMPQEAHAMTTPDLDRLAELARAATPGPWEHRPGIDPPGDIIAPHLGKYGPAPFITRIGSWGRGDDAAFIAAANPATVLALIARIREFENPDNYTPREMRLMAERDAALCRAEAAEDKLTEATP